MTSDEAETQLLAQTIDLYRLIAAGGGESEEADSLRDRMDAPWCALSEAGRQRIRDVSAALCKSAENERAACALVALAHGSAEAAEAIRRRDP